jgi:hypothetical protein
MFVRRADLFGALILLEHCCILLDILWKTEQGRYTQYE